MAYRSDFCAVSLIWFLVFMIPQSWAGPPDCSLKSYREVEDQRQMERLARATRDHGVAPGPQFPFYSYLWGNLPEIYQKGTIPYFMEVWNRFGSDGSPVKVQFGPQTMYVISDPLDIHEILIEKESRFSKGFLVDPFKKYLANQAIGFLETGEQWSALRKTMFPHFAAASGGGHSNGVQDFFPDLVERSRRFIARLEQKRNVDFEVEMALFTMQSVSANMLGMEVPVERLESIHRAFRVVVNYINDRLTWGPYLDLVTWFPIPYNQNYEAAFSEIQTLVQEMFREDEKLEKIGRGQHSVIRTLRTAQGNSEGGSLTRDSVVDQVVNLLFAGHETTTHALSMAVYHLSQEPEVVRKVLDEIQLNLGDAPVGTELRASLYKMPYLRAVVQETLRLHPSAPGTVRVATQDVQVGGYSIEKNSILFLFFNATHQLQSYWWKPEKFDPERFMPETSETHPPCGKRHPSAYTPFGQGKRICLGRFFAIQEIEIFLVELLRSGLQFKVAPGAVIETVASPTQRLENGLPMIFERPRSIFYPEHP